MDKILRTTNTTLSFDNKKSNGNDCSIDHMIPDILNSILRKVQHNNQSELKNINPNYSNVTMKLLLKDQEKLEHYNYRLGKKVTQLEDITDKHIWHIRELRNEVTRHDNAQTANDSHKRQNLINENTADRRQRMFKEIEIILELLIESYLDREIMEIEEEYDQY